MEINKLSLFVIANEVKQSEKSLIKVSIYNCSIIDYNLIISVLAHNI
jgi:hypothetical protein